MNSKWSIPTVYKDIKMRSKLETKWAEYFDKNGIKWLYEPEGFQKDGVRYLPDFALPDLKIMFEVKGVMEGSDIKKKQIMAEICEENGWKYVMGFSNIGKAFLCDSLNNEFNIEVIPLSQKKQEEKNSFGFEFYMDNPELMILGIYLMCYHEVHKAIERVFLECWGGIREYFSGKLCLFLKLMREKNENPIDYVGDFFNDSELEAAFRFYFENEYRIPDDLLKNPNSSFTLVFLEGAMAVKAAEKKVTDLGLKLEKAVGKKRTEILKERADVLKDIEIYKAMSESDAKKALWPFKNTTDLIHNILSEG